MATPSPVDLLMARLGQSADQLAATFAGISSLAAKTLLAAFQDLATNAHQLAATLGGIGSLSARTLLSAFQAVAGAANAYAQRLAATPTPGAGQATPGNTPQGRAAQAWHAGQAGERPLDRAGRPSPSRSALPIAAFNQVVGDARGFVAALNPAAVMAMDREFRNLSAAVGVALEPVIRVAVGVLAEFNSAITPVMQKLRPVVEQVAKAFGQVASVFAGAFASVLTSLAPAFRFLADVVSAVVPVLEAWYAAIAGFAEVVAGVVRGILSYFGVDMTSVMDGFKSAMKSLSEKMLLAAAHVLKFVDALAGTSMAADFARGVRRSLAPGDDDRRKTVAVATNAQVGGLAEFTNQFARNALLAGPGGVQSKDAEERARWTKLLDGIDELAAKDSSQYLAELKQAIAAAAQDIISAVAGKVYDSARDGAVRQGGMLAARASAAVATLGVSELAIAGYNAFGR
ncbi:MAG: hypothetical protein U0797_30325 [Gemmataceae bacterium]